MRKLILGALLALAGTTVCVAQTADDIIAKYIKAVGGADAIRKVTSLRRTGKFIGGGGFEATVVQENKRINSVREEFSLQGMTGITAYDGKTGWKLQPFGGKKDPETLGEEEMKSILEDADFDGPLVNYKEKGNKVEFSGTEPVEGTDALKLKITLASGDIHTYYMDTDYYVPIKVDIKRFVRGAEQEYEVTLGDYKEVNGWYLPFSIETNVKGSADRGKVAYETIEANVPIDDSRFQMPVAPAGK